MDCRGHSLVEIWTTWDKRVFLEGYEVAYIFDEYSWNMPSAFLKWISNI